MSKNQPSHLENKKFKVSSLVKFSFVFFLLLLGFLLYYYTEQLSLDKALSGTSLAGTGLVDSGFLYASQDEELYDAQRENGALEDIRSFIVTNKAIQAVSLGKVRTFEAEGSSGKKMKLSVVKFATLDTEGKSVTFDVLTQFIPEGKDKNEISWVIYAAETLLANNRIRGENKLFLDDEMETVFSSGSKWKIRPLTDYSQLDPDVDAYSLDIKDFYGEDLQEIEDFMKSGLTETTKLPIFITQISLGSVKEVNNGILDQR